MLGGDEYKLDLKIKYQVNIDEYYDMIYTQSNNKPIIKEILKKTIKIY